MTKKPLLGIIGGLGPMSSAYLYELITAHTKADTDQDHIDIILSSRASTPDRTAFITSKSTDSPLPYMVEDAKRLEEYGADFLVIACNTAHYFIDQVRKSVKIPVPSIIEETADFIASLDGKKAGIMATLGTVTTNSYQDKLAEKGIDFALPDEKYQKYLNELIYDDVKSGKSIDFEKFYGIADHLEKKGCDKIILGCTELSLINKKIGKDPRFADSLEILAYRAIRLCGVETVGFSPEFDRIK